MALQEFERRLERLVEGVFAKAFRRGLTPIEVGRRLTREMDVRRTVGVRGLIAPNEFRVAVSQEDHENVISKMEQAITRDLAGYVREHAREEGYVLVGPVDVTFEIDDKLGTGEFLVSSDMAEGEGGGPTGSLVPPDGSRVRIALDPVTIGRHPDCDVVLNDQEISRQHAEVRREDGGFVVVDLGSLNGTKVNGAGVKSPRPLEDGDTITIGTHTIRFEAS
ncbi:MAG TPA: DUF3662 and FHA domain-containing protein [Acidimicrobiales bacterium]|nr:DUF3662 and FHA domain-containing protein [Acidimicrobiales bacterium]